MHKSAAVGLALIIRQLAFRFDSLARKEHVYCTAARPDVLAVATPAMTREQWLGSYAVGHRSAAASTCDRHWLSPFFARCASPDKTLDDHRSHAMSLLKRPSAAGYLACEVHETVVAFAEAPLRRDYVNGSNSSPVGFLEGLYVEPQYRKRGLARLLCSSVEHWAKGMGCTEFASDVVLQNEVGQRVHEAVGFNATDRVVFYLKQI
jgi:aminoglycoside 6'-N-acetyltransferase I